jgi:hypothetical protein
LGIGTNNLRAKLPNPKSWHWDRTPSLSDPRLPVLGILILYVVLGITVLGFNHSPLRTNICVSNVHEKRQAEGSLLWMNAGNVDRANYLRQNIDFWKLMQICTRKSFSPRRDRL